MKNTDEIIQVAEKLAKNRVGKMKISNLPRRQELTDLIKNGFIEGYSEALRDIRKDVFVG